MKAIKFLSLGLAVMLVGTVCQPLEGEAANKGVQQWLEPGKTYSYNLDQTGKKEKIKYEKTYNEKKMVHTLPL